MAAELIQQYETKQGRNGDEARSEETHHPQARTTDTPTPAEHQMRDEETATTSDQNQNTSTSTTTEIDMEPQCKTDQLDDLLSMELQRRLEGTWQSTAQEFQTLDIKGNITYYGKDQTIQLKSAQGNTHAFRCELPNGTTGTAQLEQDDEIVRWENGTKCMRFVPPSTPKEDVAHMKEQLATMADFQGKWIKRDGRNDKVYIIEKHTAIINSDRIPFVYKSKGQMVIQTQPDTSTGELSKDKNLIRWPNASIWLRNIPISHTMTASQIRATSTNAWKKQVPAVARRKLGMQHNHVDDSQSQSSSADDDRKAPLTEDTADTAHNGQDKGIQQKGSASKRAGQSTRTEADADTESRPKFIDLPYNKSTNSDEAHNHIVKALIPFYRWSNLDFIIMAAIKELRKHCRFDALSSTHRRELLSAHFREILSELEMSDWKMALRIHLEENLCCLVEDEPINDTKARTFLIRLIDS